jgi:hypothetical protein
MRPELRWFLVLAIVLSAGALSAESYVRRAAPAYQAAANLLADSHPWRIVSVSVTPGHGSPSPELTLVGVVRLNEDARSPGAVVVDRVQVGEVAEGPIVYWTLLLLWPAKARRERLARIALGLPVFVALESMTTFFQLTYALFDTSAELAGNHSPVTLWDRWSRLLESGGRFAIEVAAALVAISATCALLRALHSEADNGQHQQTESQVTP